MVEAIDRTHHPVGDHDQATGPMPGSSSATRPSPGAIDPTKRTILGFYVCGPLGPTSDPWPYALLTSPSSPRYFTPLPRVAAQRGLGRPYVIVASDSTVARSGQRR